MKKRMLTLMSLALTAFLFLGLTSVNAQVLSPGPVDTYSGANGTKTTVVYQSATQAMTTLRTEMAANYAIPLNPPGPSTVATATDYYYLQMLLRTQCHVQQGSPVNEAAFRGYNDAVKLAQDGWETLIDETWLEDLVTLLSI